MYLIFDLETTMHGGYKKDSNPFIDTILCHGLLYQDHRLIKDTQEPKGDWLKNVTTLVGHNIKFDLMFVWESKELQNALKQGLKIWDTQLAEYILSGQVHKYPALRDIAVNKYGRSPRIKNIEVSKKDGILTHNMPIESLLIDVKNDVMDTESVALQQVIKAKNNGMYDLIVTQMDALLATTEMEMNGLYVNENRLDRYHEMLNARLENTNKELQQLVGKYWTGEFNSNSPTQLSKLFFGGTRKEIIDKPILNELGCEERIKTGINRGKIKTKKTTILNEYKGLGLKPQKDWSGKNDGIHSTKDTVLRIISTRQEHDAGKIASLMLSIRSLEKEIPTYYIATKELIYPNGVVHGELSHCGYSKEDGNYGGGTGTGRLSSRNPNLQNQPRTGDVKKHFTSRFGEDGIMVECDWRQLEVSVFGFLTQDPQLLIDLQEGIDIHRVLGASVYGCKPEEVTKEQRQDIKPGTFLCIYGGSAAKFSKDFNVSIEFAKKFIESFYGRYPIAKIWQDNLVRKVAATKQLNGKITTQGQLQHSGYLDSVTGRRYWFNTTDSPEFLKEKGLFTSFNPPEIKNYPVQGFATADFHLIAMGHLWRKSLIHRDKFLLVNTVHDSILLDVKKEFLDFTCTFVKNELYYIKDIFKNRFNIDINVPIDIEFKIGNSWGELNDYTVTNSENN